jgi:hypothetical protein
LIPLYNARFPRGTDYLRCELSISVKQGTLKDVAPRVRQRLQNYVEIVPRIVPVVPDYPGLYQI